MRFLTRSLMGLFLLALTLGLLAAAALIIGNAVQERMAGGGTAMPGAEREFTAAVVPVTPSQIVPQMQVFGEIRARRTLELRTPQAGTVIWLADGFEDGAAVKAGQPLLRLNPAEAQATRDLAQSDLVRAEAELAEARRALVILRDELAAAGARARLQQQALARQQDLAERGVGSAAAVEQAALAASSADQAVLAERAALSAAESAVALAETAVSRQAITLAEAERALAETELRAEFDGVLDGVAVVAGGNVTANEALGQIIDPSALEVSFRLSTAQFARLMGPDGALLDLPVAIRLDVSGVDISATGQLARVGAAVGAGQTGRLVYAALNAAQGFRPGDFVTVTISEPALDGVASLPAGAVGADGTVLALGADDRLEAVPVSVLRRQDDNVIIEAGALAGREVVSERSPLLGAGIRIRPVRPGATLQAQPAAELVELTDERRAALVAMVEANSRMPQDAKARVLAQLAQDKVPADVIARLEQRMGG